MFTSTVVHQSPVLFLLKVAPLVDIPGVGQNLNDHPYLTGLAWTTRPNSSFNILETAHPDVLYDYFFNRDGK
ncbi:hypothetical protein E2C01_091442 [Portunus trituberculatus]|uniref:Glucose-methanol-choline oxidoreductase N-terminal domain-containing protein n=1 Tax=Portunus trituberculatus TaxID=210409 RepID=A0A5B7JHI4_PORTR|nr:hypothetical protein [Portunus trituberculatus]